MQSLGLSLGNWKASAQSGVSKSEKPCRLGVASLGLGELKLLVEDDEGGFLGLADLSAGLGGLQVPQVPELKPNSSA
jgi:hypothetical protein